MKRMATLALILGAVLAGLAGCYVVPAPPPPALGVAPAPPPYVRATPYCHWAYGSGWYGWGWYGSC